MTRKIDAPNHGVPVMVDPVRDLPAKTENPGDSWYVICNHRVDDREIGFLWHQMVITLPDGRRVSSTELMLADATQGIWLPHTADEPEAGEIDAAIDRCCVVSSFGRFEGDAQQLTLKLSAPDGAVDLVFRPREQTLYNGTIGILPILDTTYQYAWPNMDVAGTIRLNDETFDITGASAWFDRQWSASRSAEEKHAAAGAVSSFAWLWFGMPLDPDQKSAISLWDLTNQAGKRHAFATILDEQGVQANHVADIRYEDIWESPVTGNHYPRSLQVSIPTARLELSFHMLLDRPEFDREGSVSQDGPTGCQAPCSVKGRYGSHEIDRVVIVEMAGDLCGEAKDE